MPSKTALLKDLEDTQKFIRRISDVFPFNEPLPIVDDSKLGLGVGLRVAPNIMGLILQAWSGAFILGWLHAGKTYIMVRPLDDDPPVFKPSTTYREIKNTYLFPLLLASKEIGKELGVYVLATAKVGEVRLFPIPPRDIDYSRLASILSNAFPQWFNKKWQNPEALISFWKAKEVKTTSQAIGYFFHAENTWLCLECGSPLVFGSYGRVFCSKRCYDACFTRLKRRGINPAKVVEDYRKRLRVNPLIAFSTIREAFPELLPVKRGRPKKH